MLCCVMGFGEMRSLCKVLTRRIYSQKGLNSFMSTSNGKSLKLHRRRLSKIFFFLVANEENRIKCLEQMKQKY